MNQITNRDSRRLIIPRRQVVGLRKTNSGVQKRGKARRQALVDATHDLLCEGKVEEISFLDIATRADIPEGSAYHFFANRYDVFTELANQLSEHFIEVFQEPIPARKRRDWQSLVRYLLKKSAVLHNKLPPARQLLIGGKVPPEIKQADRINEQRVGIIIFEIFQKYFELPRISRPHDVFYYFIELTDLMFSLSVIKHGKITKLMQDEAVRVSVAYLGSYFPEKLACKETLNQKPEDQS